MQTVFCRNCGSKVTTNFSEAERFGEVCSDLCWHNLKNKKHLEIGLDKKQLSLAELDHCQELDTLVEKLKIKSDIFVDRWTIPAELRSYFIGPAPNGWPKGAGLEFPIATLRNDVKEIRVAGIPKVVALLEDLLKPCFQQTRLIARASLQALKKDTNVST